MTLQEINSFYAHASRWAFPLLIILLLTSLFTCTHERGQRTDLAKRLNDMEARTQQVENERGQLVAQSDKILNVTGEEIDNLTDTIFNLKQSQERLISQVLNYSRITQETRIKGKTAPFIDRPAQPGTVVIPQPQDTNLIRVPRAFSYTDSTITFDGMVTRLGVTLDSLTIPNILHLRTVEQRTGFLNLGRVTTVQAINSNPAIKNKGIASMTIKARPNWWNSWGKPLAAAGAGIFIYSKIKK